ncbi:MAG TPA: ATP-dependent helicase [Lachnospiraceae bacterium]|jgi:DNA helicase-2/ATP-dependent DNA helicase PcrA|nr:ATP-dependent helicase [Lachnospiraceae bacterium]
MQFNNSQLKAVKHKTGPMLVIAGPGSGKTTVLTARIRNLIEEYSVNPANILVITFTKAAANEMKSRFNNMMGRSTNVTFGTFHAVFFMILRAAYNYSVDSIIKEDVRQNIIKQAIERSRLEPDDLNEMVSNITGEISRVKTETIDINAYYSASCPEEEFRDIYKYYVKTLKKMGLIDFDDMLLYCHELLTTRRDILAKWQQKYQYILIDEFQDINKIQYDIIKLLAKPQDNLFIVGDDDQSIYGFRGSKPEIMLNFDKDYPDTDKVILDTNYRSTGNIVSAAGKVIAHNKVRFAKNINTVNDPGDKVDIIEFNTQAEEYEKIIDNIRKESASGGNYSDNAVLFRTNSTAAGFVRKLVEYSVPFVTRDGVPNVFEHWIARDVITYMNIAMGSRKRSDFLQIINRPKRYIGRDYLADAEISFDNLEKYYEDKNWMIERVDRLKYDILAMASMSPYAMINYLRKGVGYDGYLDEYAQSHNMQVRELYDVMDELMESARNFKTFNEWFAYIDEYGTKLRESYAAMDKQNAVILTTMHSSKGLEYPVVYIIDANEEITPHKKAVFVPEIEEERRMFYVAMTRAKRRLNIYYARKRYNKEIEVSRFVKEIMEDGLS